MINFNKDLHKKCLQLFKHKIEQFVNDNCAINNIIKSCCVVLVNKIEMIYFKRRTCT